jgi:hypothetical protein
VILEAPPGFEPGMEVLQGHPRSFSQNGRLGDRARNRTSSIGYVDRHVAAMVCGVG